MRREDASGRGGVVFLSLVERHEAQAPVPPEQPWIPPALRHRGACADGLRHACYERLFRLLHRHAGVQAADFLRIERDGFGKPVLPPGVADVHFSLSHAGDHGLVAVSTAPVGVDIERVDPAYLSLLQDLFAHACPASEPAALFGAWARYEAVAKLLGLGLRLEVQAVRLAQGHAVAADRLVWVQPLPGPPAHVAALACLQAAPRLRWVGARALASGGARRTETCAGTPPARMPTLH